MITLQEQKPSTVFLPNQIERLKISAICKKDGNTSHIYPLLSKLISVVATDGEKVYATCKALSFRNEHQNPILNNYIVSKEAPERFSVPTLLAFSTTEGAFPGRQVRSPEMSLWLSFSLFLSQTFHLIKAVSECGTLQDAYKVLDRDENAQYRDGATAFLIRGCLEALAGSHEVGIVEGFHSLSFSYFLSFRAYFHLIAIRARRTTFSQGTWSFALPIVRSPSPFPSISILAFDPSSLLPLLVIHPLISQKVSSLFSFSMIFLSSTLSLID